MPSLSLHRLRRLLGWTAVASATVCLAIVVLAALEGTGILEGRIMDTAIRAIPWVTISETDITKGATAPPDSHIVFHVPTSVTRINREVLFGGKGETVRYWGYCLPENYDPSITVTRTGFPGELFLSEREREEQAAILKAQQPSPTVFNPIVGSSSSSRSPIRHQIDLFQGGMLCYLMTESPLAMGLDRDRDMLNDRVEMNLGTKPEIADTDGDGLGDGIEVRGGTNPLVRDSDGDGLIDGLEDRNFNGRVDINETSPKNRDSDRDELCDGYCKLRLPNAQEIWLGEDVNLSGIQDSNETNPLSWDSDGDGMSDSSAYFACRAGDTQYCLGSTSSTPAQ